MVIAGGFTNLEVSFNESGRVRIKMDLKIFSVDSSSRVNGFVI